MDDAARVGIVDCLTNLQKNVEQTTQAEASERPGVIVAAPLENRLERATGDELHREVSVTVGRGTQVVHRNDVRMLELRRDLRFFGEPRKLVPR
jgi:hypothetical protein